VKDIFGNKVVWITGASSGIGEALAYGFNNHNARIIISSRNIKDLEKVKSNCNKSDPNIKLLPFDLDDLDSIKESSNAALSFYGRIDYMVHNAGAALRDLAVDTVIEMDEKIMRINYFGPIQISKMILPSMIANRSGHFVVISSLSGKYGVPKLSAYAASKHALHGFFDSLRSEVHEYNIKITMIVPGIIKTNILKNAFKGDGSRYDNSMKAKEQWMSSDTCARIILKKVAGNKEEAVVGKSEIYSVYFRRFFPALYSKMLRNRPLKKIRRLKRLFTPGKKNQFKV
jgi:dehydrogenase/reductase SDR family protein 7B